jgi:hypothetical protein
MEGSGPYTQLLAQIPAFAPFSPEQLEALYGFCALKVLAKGEAASIAGAAVDELCIVVSGWLSAGRGYEAGRGEAVETAAFFARAPARATAIALRETILLTLAWEDLAAAFQANPDLIGTVLSRMDAGRAEEAQTPPPPSRLVICPAGAGAQLDHRVREALLAGLESVAEVRVLSRQSFGAGMPGALAVESPEIAHWLQEQELEFDLTLIVADETDIGFAAQAIAEADEVLFVASGSNPALSVLERHALEVRGAQHCRLIFEKSEIGPVNHAADWVGPRGFAHAQAVDFDSSLAVRLMGQAITGRGHAIAAASTGVYAAAILGAMQAMEEQGLPAVALAAAGSAVLPAGLLACGMLGAAHRIFQELADPLLWKRSSRPDVSLFDPVPLDNFLVGALQGLEIPIAGRAFAAVSRSLSAGAAEVHRTGKLHGAVRAGIAPAGMLPPLILDSGDILISGENESSALLAAVRSLTASPVLGLCAEMPPLGPSQMSYRSLTGGALFRASQSIDKRVRADAVLGAAYSGFARVRGARTFVLPVPEGIAPMDWPQWAILRDMAYEWTMRELEAREASE